MYIDDILEQLDILTSALEFQERRNFFNKKEDKHLPLLIEIIATFYEQLSSNAFKSENLKEALYVLSRPINAINAGPELVEKIHNFNMFLEYNSN